MSRDNTNAKISLDDKAIGRGLCEEGRELYALLKPMSTLRKLKSGEYVMSQDEDVDSITYIISGRAKASIYSYSGQEVWIADFEAGDLIGHGALLRQQVSNYNVVAHGAMQVLSLSAKAFLSLLETKTEISVKAAQDLSQRFHVMTRRLVEMATLTTPERIGYELKRMAKPVGIASDQMIIRPAPVLTQLALRVHSTRETVSRTVSDLQKSGVLNREPGAILIMDPDKLSPFDND